MVPGTDAQENLHREPDYLEIMAVTWRFRCSDAECPGYSTCTLRPFAVSARIWQLGVIQASPLLEGRDVVPPGMNRSPET